MPRNVVISRAWFGKRTSCMDPQEKATIQLHGALKECFDQIRFARAAELARSRRYLEAEGLLSPNGRDSSDPKELDLLARISAQQRRYGRARRLWETALQQSPGNAAYERAIERTKDAERFQAMLQKAAMIVLVALVMAAVVIAVSNLFLRHSPRAASDKQPDLRTKTTPLPSCKRTRQIEMKFWKSCCARCGDCGPFFGRRVLMPALSVAPSDARAAAIESLRQSLHVCAEARPRSRCSLMPSTSPRWRIPWFSRFSCSTRSVHRGRGA